MKQNFSIRERVDTATKVITFEFEVTDEEASELGGVIGQAFMNGRDASTTLIALAQIISSDLPGDRRRAPAKKIIIKYKSIPAKVGGEHVRTQVTN